MYGAILGDMIGAPYEFDMGYKSKEFPLFIKTSVFTDDSVMTIAVAQALLNARDQGKLDSESTVTAQVTDCMRVWGRAYPRAGYGGMFRQWLRDADMGPYNSFGNGSAMRVSAAGWLADSEEQALKLAAWTAQVTHNHSEGIKGAQATALAIFMARQGRGKDDIKNHIVSQFGYDLSKTCDEIRPHYHHVETCQGTVPQAITAFLEGADFEDAIRTAVSLGGDCDTLTCITGGMAEAYYGVPEHLKSACRRRLKPDMIAVCDRFDDALGR